MDIQPGSLAIFKEQFSRRLRDALDERNIREGQLARAIDATPTTISNYVNGHTLPTLHKFFAICAVLRMQPNDFFTFKFGGDA